MRNMPTPIHLVSASQVQSSEQKVLRVRLRASFEAKFFDIKFVGGKKPWAVVDLDQGSVTYWEDFKIVIEFIKCH